MLLPALFAALTAIAPGSDVDHAADDRAIFQQLEKATAELAESGKSPLTSTQRLAQCQRPQAAKVALRAPSQATLGGEEAYRRAAAASVLIGSAYKCAKCTRWHNTLASGVVVDTDGVVATNYHVAAGELGEAMGVLTADGKFHAVTEVLAANKDQDVALLRVAGKGLAALPLRDDAGAGAPIYCYSHPANSFGCLSEGVIARYCRLPGERNGAIFMQITADYARGSSGGPILDHEGNLVGLVSSTSPIFYDSPGAAKDGKPAVPNLQMVRHNCVTARAIRDLVGASGR
jgi:S1-C subfamily serine protease